MKTIKANAIICKKCYTIIISRYRHECACCDCGEVAVDGGNDYLRRLGDSKNYIELSVVKEENK